MLNDTGYKHIILQCQDCDAIIDEGKIIKIVTRCNKYITRCPFCNSENLTEIIED